MPLSEEKERVPSETILFSYCRRESSPQPDAIWGEQVSLFDGLQPFAGPLIDQALAASSTATQSEDYLDLLRHMGFSVLSNGSTRDIPFFHPLSQKVPTFPTPSASRNQVYCRPRFPLRLKDGRVSFAALLEASWDGKPFGVYSGVAVEVGLVADRIDGFGDIGQFVPRSDLRYLCLMALRGASAPFVGHPPFLGIRAPSPSSRLHCEPIQEQITALFESRLKHSPRNDRWKIQGRGSFVERVGFFVSRDLPLHMVLPAFPCKSANRNKTSGILPDKGEELAIRTLGGFAESVRRIYPPGCRIHIVSDGHVFSDLIGVDDSNVTLYTDELARLTRGVEQQGWSGANIEFHSLQDLLPRLEDPKLARRISERGCFDSSRLEAKLGGMISETQQQEDERRSMLLTLFGSLGLGDIQKSIRNDSDALRLYRGFSKFVLEDLRGHPSRCGMSNTSQKRLAGGIAKLMLQRNQAYSKLVEICFPSAIRLSIHPHDNSGPKYGINLIHKSLIQHGDPIDSGQYFHIPTPWHNSVVLDLDGRWKMLRCSELDSSRSTERHRLRFHPNQPCKGEGGYFYFVPEVGTGGECMKIGL
ncbi:hypothetical protein IE53DRAFT_385314 [Violaceomyces palustris]|uniref:Uncharacterized protein n=1 Tax=Violaceomyces palustris TaxID=1673888 RepID=A0ACD0P2V5_9BASI|nr:hypothetical protein IE53DRAFT_385314 [Violaceomyces palustris]